MIRKQDILDRTAEWRLRPEVVEKDYVLGWVLAALAHHEETRRCWVFKGGTCIKKCYMETYRFSEDLDFSLLPEAAYTPEAIHRILAAVARLVHDLSGIDMPTHLITVRERRNRQGQMTFQGRLGYRGPLAYPGFPRILLDLTRHEPIYDPPIGRTPYHPYPDALPADTAILAYSLDELLAEKTRALYERTRPRDLYDVVYLLDNQPDAVDLSHLHTLFRQKCAAKHLAAPSVADLLSLVRTTDELRGEWENMLAHQLPSLPRLDDLLSRLLDLLGWIDRPAILPAARALPAAPIPAGLASAAPAGIHYWGEGSALESIRFAGANRLLVEFDSDGTRRRVEPYSLRRANTGNILLYGWEEGATHIKAFNLARIRRVRATETTFQPRYRIELTPEETVSIPQAAIPTRQITPSQRRFSRLSGPAYVFECTHCGRQFRHSKNNPVLRQHKTKDGYRCTGRRGYLIRVE